MNDRRSVIAHIIIGRDVGGETVGNYRFHALPRIGEHIAIDSEDGDPKHHRELTVTSVNHFPVSLEAPMGDAPTIEEEYVMILCSES